MCRHMKCDAEPGWLGWSRGLGGGKERGGRPEACTPCTFLLDQSCYEGANLCLKSVHYM